MPLVLICGPPCSGKTTLAGELEKYFRQNSNYSSPILISDESRYNSIGQSRDAIYSQSNLEKQLRGYLKDEVTRSLTDQQLVIFDAQNYIKGFRYELFCVVKAAKTSQCVVLIDCDLEQSLSFNEKDGNYSKETIQALFQRFETPNPDARWDSPLVRVNPGVDVGEALRQIHACVSSRGKKLPPNLSTQNPPRMAADLLYDLDQQSQALVRKLFEKISIADIGDTIALEGAPDHKLVLSRKVSMPELQRVRRHFLDFYKTHTIKQNEAVPPIFMQFVINSLL